MSQDVAEYKYSVEIYKQQSSRRLGAVAIEVDWDPLLEWAGFTAIRKDASRPMVLGTVGGRVEPIWDQAAGRPYVEGLRAIVAQHGRSPAVFKVPLKFFNGLAQHASAKFVDDGQLVKGETFQYAVCAYEAQRQPVIKTQRPQVRFSVEPVAQVLDLDEQPLDCLLCKCTPCGPIDEDQMPAFIPSGVLEEAVELANKAGCVETGGILIGHLHRDSTRPDVLLEVTAQIPARHVEQDATRLAFTPQTWADVDAAVALRNRGEIYLGWWHSHPASQWCGQCPPEKRAECKLSGDFLSLYDVALHRAVFPRAYSIALVISESHAGGLPVGGASAVWRLFGWRYGQLAPRGFHIIPAVDLVPS